MNGVSTITQKGQVVIPRPIRKYFNLRKSSKIYFEVINNKIVAKPIMTIEQAFGMVKSRKTYSKKEFKKAIEEEVIKKYTNK